MLLVFEPKGLERQAVLARAHFALHGPRDAPPLPIGYDEREQTKRHLVATIAALEALVNTGDLG